jgi:hypothetical protein
VSSVRRTFHTFEPKPREEVTRYLVDGEEVRELIGYLTLKQLRLTRGTPGVFRATVWLNSRDLFEEKSAAVEEAIRRCRDSIQEKVNEITRLEEAIGRLQKLRGQS